MKKTTLKRKRPIRRVSKRYKKEIEKYYRLREKFLQDHPLCALCGRPSTEVHHRRGRGRWLNVVSTWMALERNCHTMIHDNPRVSRENGWLISKFAK